MYLMYRGKKKVLIIKWKQTRKKKGLNQHQPKSTYEAKQIKITTNYHIVHATTCTLSYPTNHYGALKNCLAGISGTKGWGKYVSQGEG